MDKSKLWILEGTSIGIAVVLAVIFISRGVNLNSKTPASGDSSAVDSAAPKEIKYSTSVPTDVKPTTPTESAPVGDGKSELNFFNLVASKNGFSPSIITVKKGDLAQLKFLAQDGDYDFFIPATALHDSAKKGETKQILIQLTDSGTFVFECRDSCPASGKISGQLIVLPQ